MSRTLNTSTLTKAARHYAAEFLRPDVPHANVEGKFIGGRAYVMQDFFNFTYKDEFGYILEAIRGQLGPDALTEFDAASAEKFTPRSDEVLADELANRLAVDLDGNHIDGKVGIAIVGTRTVGKMVKLVSRKGGVQTPVIKNLYWNIYAGEAEERIASAHRQTDDPDYKDVLSVVDELPVDAEPLSVGALNTRISNDFAIAMVDAGVALLDVGSLGGVIQGRDGSQPADPDTGVTGNNLFTLTMQTTAFAGAIDGAPGADAVADTIVDDTSADFTATLGYCRASASSVSDTPLAGEDHIDGEAGTSGADFNFNTLEIVSGATVSMTSWIVTQPES